jgi:hypothetical protein
MLANLGATMTGGTASQGAALAGGALGRGAGLVPSKTSLHGVLSPMIDLSRPAVAERRVKCLKKAVWSSGHLHGIVEKGFRAARVWFVTLTYRGVNDWRADHVSQAIQRYRNWCRKIGVPCKYTWVAELQSRGAVHYHLMAWLPPRVRMPKWDKGGMGRPAFWGHGWTNTQVARAGVGYLMKYLSKLGELTVFPKGLRLYGIGGLDKPARAVRTWLNWPEWLKASYGVGECNRLARGFMVHETGEILSSPYRVRLIPGGLLCELVGEIAPRFHDGPYSRVSF